MLLQSLGSIDFPRYPKTIVPNPTSPTCMTYASFVSKIMEFDSPIMEVYLHPLIKENLDNHDA